MMRKTLEGETTMGRKNTGLWALVFAIGLGAVATPLVAGVAGWSVMGALGIGAQAVVDAGRQAAGPVQESDFRWAGRLDAGQTIEIRGVNGGIEAVEGSGSEVVVTATKRGRRSNPDEVRIEVVEHGAGVTVCAIYPSRGDRNTCEPGGGGRNEVRDNDVSVSFRVEVPAGIHLGARTVNGDIEAEGLGGDVDATTVNGGVRLSTTGFAQARTVNGSIRATMGEWRGEAVSFATVNGSIELDVPDDIDARVEARWVNGGLETDLPMMLQGRMSRHSASAVLGDGGPELNLKTVNGSIRIR